MQPGARSKHEIPFFIVFSIVHSYAHPESQIGTTLFDPHAQLVLLIGFDLYPLVYAKGGASPLIRYPCQLQAILSGAADSRVDLDSIFLRAGHFHPPGNILRGVFLETRVLNQVPGQNLNQRLTLRSM